MEAFFINVVFSFTNKRIPGKKEGDTKVGTLILCPCWWERGSPKQPLCSGVKRW
jgi:hypothetical protein